MEITIKDLDAILANRVYPLNEPLSKNSVLIIWENILIEISISI